VKNEIESCRTDENAALIERVCVAAHRVVQKKGSLPYWASGLETMADFKAAWER
jgi:hypothetical protein